MSIPSNAIPTWDTKDAEKRYTKLKENADRFRVVIIGGANAGKTTILKKICDTIDDPEIYNSYGRKIDSSNIEPTALRGEHDIGNEMVFRSNPTYIFHDSRGFEAGGVDEFRKVKAFVADSAKQLLLKHQVHAIWYCIAMDDDRPITYAEKQFFSESGTGRVPVIAVFTKCEALEVKAIIALQDEGYDFDEAIERAPKYVEEKLKNVHKILEAMQYPPRGHVYLQELEKPEGDCRNLVKCTAEVLDSKVLQGLLISAQQNSMETSMEFSLK
ncbi:hypothetical protein BDZ94DRAFT_1175201 [Collybia nuda]|uniref:G domain-containing protein n=1 Tax=Collybia nuda TaxID=64659 RepID=A0A9P6CE35_9AGAR|nr:hypothetical protein BDZ94DRAFT_1175201 [Collybia nuda]